MEARIIPAGAGHFDLLNARLDPRRDHPRRCGALPLLGGGFLSVVGSSPQVRGTYGCGGAGVVDGGIIPAGAGHLIWVVTLAVSPGDHPRRCGALVLRTDRAPRLLGSSPQVRGTSLVAYGMSRPKGIIPAGAGHLRGEP